MKLLKPTLLKESDQGLILWQGQDLSTKLLILPSVWFCFSFSLIMGNNRALVAVVQELHAALGNVEYLCEVNTTFCKQL